MAHASEQYMLVNSTLWTCSGTPVTGRAGYLRPGHPALQGF